MKNRYRVEEKKKGNKRWNTDSEVSNLTYKQALKYKKQLQHDSGKDYIYRIKQE